MQQVMQLEEQQVEKEQIIIPIMTGQMLQMKRRLLLPIVGFMRLQAQQTQRQMTY